MIVCRQVVVDEEFIARREKGTDRVRYSAAFDAPPASELDLACRNGLEGVIAKGVAAEELLRPPLFMSPSRPSVKVVV